MHFMDEKKKVWSLYRSIFKACRNRIKQLYFVISLIPNIITMGTHKCKIQQNITVPYDLASVFSVMESHVLPPPPLSTSTPLTGKGNCPTKWFSLTPRGDKVHFEATQGGLSLKHPAIHNCGFDKPAFFSQQVKWKSFLMDLTPLPWKPTSPTAPPNEPCAILEREINVTKM